MKFNKINHLLKVMMLPGIMGMVSANALADNMQFSGTLVYAPCKIGAGDEALTVAFDTIVDKYLYINTRTDGQKFSLNLTDCDISTAKNVKLTFQGKENPNLKGLLAVDGVKGVGIGLETTEKTPVSLPVNQQGPDNLLSTGTTVLTFNAYVQGEPQAITAKTITLGSFNAESIFILEYE